MFLFLHPNVMFSLFVSHSGVVPGYFFPSESVAWLTLSYFVPWYEKNSCRKSDTYTDLSASVFRSSL